MKITQKDIEKIEAKTLDGMFDTIKPYAVSSDQKKRIEQKVNAKTGISPKKRFNFGAVIAVAAAVALAVAAVPVVNGVIKNKPAVVESVEPSVSEQSDKQSDAQINEPSDTTPADPSNDPQSEPDVVPPVDSTTADPVSSDVPPVDSTTTDPTSSDVPPVSSTPDQVSSTTPPVSSTPVSSTPDPVSSDNPPVSSTPDNTSGRQPQRSVDLDKVDWQKQHGGTSGDEVWESIIVNGMEITEDLDKAIKRNESGIYGIVVLKKDDQGNNAGYAGAADAELFFEICNFADLKNGKLYLFPTKEELFGLDLTDEQKAKYKFQIITRASYTGIPSVKAPASDISDWEGIDPQKFAVYVVSYEDGYANSYEDTESLKYAFDNIFKTLAWYDDPTISVFCYLNDLDFEEADYEYLEFKKMNVYDSPKRVIFRGVKLSKLDVNDIRALSDDAKITKVILRMEDNPLPD